MKVFKLKKDNLLIFLLIFFGFLLQLYFILSREIFTDEVFYRNVALSSSFSSILTYDHWIKDHGLFFLFILKILTYISKNIVILRLFNLIFYIVLTVSCFNFFKSINKKKFAYLFVFAYLINSYFIFTSSVISPFNFVSFFSILTIIKLLEYFFVKSSNKNLILFNILSILSFYSDFSSVYLFFSLLILIIILFSIKKKLFPFIFSALFQAVFILPGVFYALKNFKKISNLNPSVLNFNLNFYQFIEFFFDIVLLRIGKSYSLIIFTILALSLVFITIKKTDIFLRKLSLFTLFSFIVNILFTFFFSKYFFYILSERIFWHIYFIEIFAFSLIGSILSRKLLTIFYISLVSLFLIRIIDINGSLIQGRVTNEDFQYKSIINEIKKSNIIYFDKNYGHVPLKDYYLNRGIVVKDIYQLKKTLNYNYKDKEVVLIIFDNSYESKILNLFKNKNIKIYTTLCKKDQCLFIKKH